jgi:hypothetical protein
MSKVLIFAVGGIILLVVFLWIGLQIQPRPFPNYPGQTPALKTIPLPEGLPEPVARFYQGVYGDEIPVIESAVITGRATLRVSGITFPARFRFTHVAGQDYRHYIEATVFGLPLMQVNESYLDGESRMETPGGVIEKEPKINQAANLGLWAESVWLPSIFITDPRVRWELVDDHTALLRVPFGELEETFTVRFDPGTGQLTLMEAMRYREAADERKVLWISEAVAWEAKEGRQYLKTGALTWLDQGWPWAVFTVEELIYNVDVSEYVRDRGL